MLHLALAVVAGALAGHLGSAYGTASPAVRTVAIIVAAVLVTLPLFVDADDPLASALTGLAEDIPEPGRAALRDGAELRRCVDEAMLDRRTARQVRQTWRALLRLAQARARIEAGAARRANGDGSSNAHARSVVDRLDQRLVEHVAALRKAYMAADAANAAELSLDDRALRSTEDLGDSMEQTAQVILDEPG